MGFAISAHIYVHVRVWPPCTFARDTEGSGCLFYALSEGLQGGTAPDKVGVSCRAFTRARLARSGWGFRRARRGLYELERLDAWVSERLTPCPRRPTVVMCPKGFWQPPQRSARPS